MIITHAIGMLINVHKFSNAFVEIQAIWITEDMNEIDEWITPAVSRHHHHININCPIKVMATKIYRKYWFRLTRAGTSVSEYIIIGVQCKTQYIVLQSPLLLSLLAYCISCKMKNACILLIMQNMEWRYHFVTFSKRPVTAEMQVSTGKNSPLDHLKKITPMSGVCIIQ